MSIHFASSKWLGTFRGFRNTHWMCSNRSREIPLSSPRNATLFSRRASSVACNCSSARWFAEKGPLWSCSCFCFNAVICLNNSSDAGSSGSFVKRTNSRPHFSASYL